MNTANLNIPSAEELEKYEQIKPGYSDRILTLPLLQSKLTNHLVRITGLEPA